MKINGDPVYYKKAIGDLIKQAIKEGLEVDLKLDLNRDQAIILFKDIISGEAAGVNIQCVFHDRK